MVGTSTGILMYADVAIIHSPETSAAAALLTAASACDSQC